MDDKRIREGFKNMPVHELRFTNEDRNEVFEQINKMEKNNNTQKKSLDSISKQFSIFTASLLVVGLFLVLIIPSIFQGNSNNDNNDNNGSNASGVRTQDSDYFTTPNGEDAQLVQRREQNNQAKEIEVVSESEKESAYIVFDGYYYMKTGQVVPELSSDWNKIGEVKRIGDWAIKRSGDTNEVPPGPIYQMVEKDKSTIAAKGVYYEDGANKEGYLLFKKGKEVKEDINPDTIQSAVSDKEELAIAFNNAKEHFPDLYAFLNGDHYQLHLLNAMEKYDSIKMIYMVPEQKDTSILVLEYKNNIPLDSAFHKKRKPPTEQDKLDINNMNWTIYKDQEGLYLAVTSFNKKHYEIQFAGNFELSFVEESLNLFHKVN